MATQHVEADIEGFGCRSCGSPARVGDSFCGRCGVAVRPIPVDGVEPRIGLAGFHFEEGKAARPSLRARVGSVVRGVKRRAGLVVLASLIVVLVGAGAFWGVSYTRNGPVRDALDRAEARIGPVNQDVAKAGTVDELVAAAGGYAAITDDLGGLRVDASAPGGDFADAAERLIGAQQALAVAGSGLSSVTVGDVAEWGTARTALLDTIVEYEEATDVLHGEDGDRAGDAALPDDFAQHVRDLTDQAVLGSAGQGLEGMFTRMTAARLTSDLRGLASYAGDAELVLRGVMGGFDESSTEYGRLASFSDLYAALSAMSGLDGDHLSGWAEVRKDIVGTTASLKLEDRSFSIGVRESLGEVDRVVDDAQRKLREWRVAYRHAVAEKSADTETLADYKAGMNAQLERYSALRESLADWIDRVEDPANFVTYAEGYDVLWRAQTDREAVRDAMNTLTVPSALTSRHAALVAVVDDAIAAVSAAYQGTFDADICTYTCYYKDSPGWQLFTSESGRITDEYATTVGAWNRTVSAADEAVRNRALPERPVV